VTRPEISAQARDGLARFLDEGQYGDMEWMATHRERRGDPRAMWAQVRTVIMLGVNYGPDRDPLSVLGSRDRGAISVYAQGDDYHDFIKKRLKRLARWRDARCPLSQGFHFVWPTDPHPPRRFRCRRRTQAGRREPRPASCMS
jgi:epoxyqueuosine reductase